MCRLCIYIYMSLINTYNIYIYTNHFIRKWICRQISAVSKVLTKRLPGLQNTHSTEADSLQPAQTSTWTHVALRHCTNASMLVLGCYKNGPLISYDDLPKNGEFLYYITWPGKFTALHWSLLVCLVWPPSFLRSTCFDQNLWKLSGQTAAGMHQNTFMAVQLESQLWIWVFGMLGSLARRPSSDLETSANVCSPEFPTSASARNEQVLLN